MMITKRKITIVVVTMRRKPSMENMWMYSVVETWMRYIRMRRKRMTMTLLDDLDVGPLLGGTGTGGGLQLMVATWVSLY